MNLLKIPVLLLCVILLESCAAILSGSKQDVAISVPSADTRLYIDSTYISTGNNFNVTINKEWNNKQLRFEAEGYKPRYNVLIRDHKSYYYILSWIPGIIVAAPYVDHTANTWCYEDSYQFEALRKYNFSDPTRKRLYVRNVSFANAAGNYTVRNYPYSNYVDKGDPSEIFPIDSAEVAHPSLHEDLQKVLIKLKYVDTLNTVFIDNSNTLELEPKVIKYSQNLVYRLYKPVQGSKAYSSFIEVALATLWTLKNSYGDTIRQDTIYSISGQFSSSYYSPRVRNRMALSDALESSMLDFIDILHTQKLIEHEKPFVPFTDPVTIARPTKTPKDVEEGMKATVIVKNKDSHGSGFLISHDGYLITNHHVVRNSGDYTVVLNDGSEYKATVVRSNKNVDLALLKITGTFEYAYVLPVTQNASIGDDVFAIGAPKSIQLGQSVAKGIVSGIRTYKGLNYIQTDIGINFGNSGGPIVTGSAELAGVVVSKIVGWGSEGLSFSVPSWDVLKNLKLLYE